MTWLEERHDCNPPWDEIPADENLWIRYWLCDLCGTQWRCTVGEYGGGVAVQKVANTRY